MGKIVTLGVLAAANKGKRQDLKNTLYHAADESTYIPLCGKVKPESLVDDGSADTEPTCPLCRKRDPRLKGDGPFSLKTLLQF